MATEAVQALTVDPMAKAEARAEEGAAVRVAVLMETRATMGVAAVEEVTWVAQVAQVAQRAARVAATGKSRRWKGTADWRCGPRCSALLV